MFQRSHCTSLWLLPSSHLSPLSSTMRAQFAQCSSCLCFYMWQEACTITGSLQQIYRSYCQLHATAPLQEMEVFGTKLRLNCSGVWRVTKALSSTDAKLNNAGLTVLAHKPEKQVNFTPLGTEWRRIQHVFHGMLGSVFRVLHSVLTCFISLL